MRLARLLLLALVGCSSNGSSGDAGPDAGPDAVADAAPNACEISTSDASLTCDVSAVPPADLGCTTWEGVSSSSGGGVVSCPAAGSGWGGGAGSDCTYEWTKSGSPDLCQLPNDEDGTSPFGWLHPTCNNGCDASIDVAPPAPCATNADCDPTTYCEVHGNCGGSGTCYPIAGGGTGFKSQVCGCDGKTYASYDDAHAARVSVAYDGACE